MQSFRYVYTESSPLLAAQKHQALRTVFVPAKWTLGYEVADLGGIQHIPGG